LTTKDNKRSRVLALEPKDEWSYHFWFGIKCGYPLCCILWFVDSKTNNGLQEGSLYERLYREVYQTYMPTKTNVDFEPYSMCPDCVTRKISLITLQKEGKDE